MRVPKAGAGKPTEIVRKGNDKLQLEVQGLRISGLYPPGPWPLASGWDGKGKGKARGISVRPVEASAVR